MRNALPSVAAVSALLLAATLGAGLPVTGTLAAAPAPRAESGLPFDAAVAAAVRDAFDGTAVQVELTRVDVVGAHPAQRELLAHGRIAVAGSGWIPVEVAALYDVASATASAQRISLPGADAPRAADGALAGGLAEEAAHRLRDEFAGQPATLQLSGVRAASVADDLLVLDATGRADFGGEGVAAAAVHALYDARNGRWLRVDYQLGDDGLGDPVAGL